MIIKRADDATKKTEEIVAVQKEVQKEITKRADNVTKKTEEIVAVQKQVTKRTEDLVKKDRRNLCFGEGPDSQE